MKTIDYKVSYEKMITRIPGLFAYLEADEFGNMVLHKATDSNDGCYGKIVENIKLPEDINLKVNGVTLLSQEETYTFRTLISYYYQYKDYNFVLEGEDRDDDSFIGFIDDGIGKFSAPYKYKKEDDTEDTILTLSEFPAMPKNIYLSNVLSLYNSLVKLSKQCKAGNEEFIKKDKYLCCICEKYHMMGGDNFKDYVATLISKANEIAKEYYNYATKETDTMALNFDVDLAASFEDLGIMNCYVAEWIPYKPYYNGDKVYYDGKIYKCICKDKYKLKDYVNKTDGTYIITIGEYNDLTDVQKKNYEPRYENSKDEADIITAEVYEGKYTSGKYEEDIEKVVFDVDNFEEVEFHMNYDDITKANYEVNEYVNKTDKNDKINVNTYNALTNSEKKNYKPSVYKNKNNEDDIITAEEYKKLSISYEQYEELKSNDRGKYEPNDAIQLNGGTDSKLRDLRRIATYVNLTNEPEVPKEGTDWLFYYRKGLVLNITTRNDELGNILSLSEAKKGVEKAATSKDDLLAYGDVIEDIIANKTVYKIYKYINVNEPNIIIDVSVYNGIETDEVKEQYKPYQYKNDEYGTVISADEYEYLKDTITFIYRTGVHLKAKVDADDDDATDDDGNKIYNWKELEWDGDEKVGMMYEETYPYMVVADAVNDGDYLCKLIDDGIKIEVNNDGAVETKKVSFDDYIVGYKIIKYVKYEYNQSERKYVCTEKSIEDYEEITDEDEKEKYSPYVYNFDKALKNYKFEFITINNSIYYDKSVANQDVRITSNITDFEVHRNDYSEFIESEVFRYDYYNGVSYAPSKDIDVHIERGSTDAFQKHIAFGEVKTLDDMETYKNGSFFALSEA